ncbi:hypothetical protein LT679_09950 [Mucilaginibacter roseus]|uniref:Uncharacterized protein n=1 Tax=Mucilaginibacter roseus TaxID=1528868 RepID=A0ABS8U1C9_9SPHI|nr:hypothetical protein [Mucilaginibacter roseus]MCD8740923.1 hypothetical protein [Mucilaginibacter roseus]
MSNDKKNCRPLRTEWVPSAYRNDSGAEPSSRSAAIPNITGFAKKMLKTEFCKRSVINR